MFCRACGTENPEGNSFCNNCGASLLAGAPAPQQGGVMYPNAKSQSNSLLCKPNLIGIIASAMIVIATFLPFASVNFLGTSISASLMDGGDGIFFIIVAALGILFSILGINIVVSITGVISILLFFIDASSFKDGNDALTSSLLQKGSGYYLILLGSLVLIVAGIIGYVMKKRQ